MYNNTVDSYIVPQTFDLCPIPLFGTADMKARRKETFGTGQGYTLYTRWTHPEEDAGDAVLAMDVLMATGLL